MGKSQGVNRKSRVFKNEGILIHIPKYNQDGEELFVGEKPFAPHDDVLEPVINFYVYKVDAKGDFIPEKNFSKNKLFLQVGYYHIHSKKVLIIYGGPDDIVQRFTLEHSLMNDIPGEFYGFPGSVTVELSEIPPDPNVGWGG